MMNTCMGLTRHRERGAVSLAVVALILAIAALAMASYVLFNCCEKTPKRGDGSGPGTKKVRIKNESGGNINLGMKVQGAGTNDGSGTRWPIGPATTTPVPHGNNPGPFGSSLSVSDPGFWPWNYTPPPNSRTWVISCTLEDMTEMHDVLIRTPGVQNGVHIHEVLARLEVKSQGASKWYRFNYDVAYWKLIGFPGSWVPQSPAMGQTTPWVASAANP